MRKIKQFKQFHVGQRVFYSGVTSYSYDDSKVKRAKGTIIVIGGSVCIELDEYRNPYYVSNLQSNPPSPTNIYIIPKKQYANVGVADLVTGTKALEVI